MANLDAKLDKINDKLDEIKDDVVDISFQTKRNTDVLEEHQRRSIALEEYVSKIELELLPIKSHVNLVSIAFKVLVWVAGAVAATTLFILQVKGLLL